MIAFGPVPSRRLGHSLGINNIPQKICTYSCIYCQLGRTNNMCAKRRVFYEPEEVLEDVKKKIKEAEEMDEPIDYLAFVPDGEPTLDINLGKEIELLRKIDIKIAVITNASLIWMEDVQNDLCKADWVSLKIDSISNKVWYGINRPHKSLDMDKILQGMERFSNSFNGKLTTETVLVRNVNDNFEELRKIADFITKIKPEKSYISTPTRPPAEKWVKPATEYAVNMAYQIFEKSLNVEYLVNYEGNAFAFTGDIKENLLSITSVHPMREDGIREFLKKADAQWDIIEQLIKENKLVETKYRGKKFYMNRL